MDNSTTPFPRLLLAVVNSILEVVVLCVSGYILSRRGLLDKKTRKKINRINITLFTPALLFSKVAFFLTPEKLKELWIIPMWFLLVTGTSMFIGCMLGAVFHLRRSQRNFTMAAAMFMNSNSLPIALMQSLVLSVPDLGWDRNDNPDAMVGRALTYLTMYSTLGMMLRYSYGIHLLSASDDTPVDSESQPNETTPLLPPSTSQHDLPPPHVLDLPPPFSRAHSRASSITQQKSNVVAGAGHPQPVDLLASDRKGISEESKTLTKPQSHFRRGPSYNSFPNTPRDSFLTLPRYEPRIVGWESDSDEEVTVAPPSPLPFLQRVLGSISRVWTAIQNFMTAPLWAALLSLAVAFVEPLKQVLEHMQPVTGAVNTAGKCSIPLTLVVLGAYFHESHGDKATTTQPSTQTTGEVDPKTWQRFAHANSIYIQPSQSPTVSDTLPCPGETKTVIMAILTRMFITPILLVPVLVTAAKFSWQAVLADPVFVTVNTILLCSPPAVTLAQIVPVSSGDIFERLISRTIFWSYCFVTPPVTIGCVLLSLWLSKT